MLASGGKKIYDVFSDFLLQEVLHFGWFNLFMCHCYARKARALKDIARYCFVINRREIDPFHMCLQMWLSFSDCEIDDAEGKLLIHKIHAWFLASNVFWLPRRFSFAFVGLSENGKKEKSH